MVALPVSHLRLSGCDSACCGVSLHFTGVPCAVVDSVPAGQNLPCASMHSFVSLGAPKNCTNTHVTVTENENCW